MSLKSHYKYNEKYDEYEKKSDDEAESDEFHSE